MTGYQQCVNYYICNHQYYIKYSIHFKNKRQLKNCSLPEQPEWTQDSSILLSSKSDVSYLALILRVHTDHNCFRKSEFLLSPRRQSKLFQRVLFSKGLVASKSFRNLFLKCRHLSKQAVQTILWIHNYLFYIHNASQAIWSFPVSQNTHPTYN